MRNLLRWLLVAAVVLAANAAVADRDIDGVPIPDDAAMAAEPPTGSFRGAWVGRWGGKRKHILIVESVAPDGKARVVYAWGVGPQPGSKAGWDRSEARVSDDMLKFTGTTPDGKSFRAIYQMTSATWVEALYFEDGLLRGEAELKRTSFIALPGMKFADSEGKSIMIDSGLHENGRPVGLEVVIFKPEGAGRFPLLVVNHGSTGQGKDETLFKLTYAKRAFAEIFVNKGYLVAYPQRRGRGNSDGLYDEGFNVDRALGYACEPGRSLAGAERALGDIEAAVAVLRRRADVAAGPMLMVGHSRGGALSIAYAGKYPNDVAGVINFVGGWIDTKDCKETASDVNKSLLRRGGAFRRSTLWLYGNNDNNYSIEHSRENLRAFEKDGGQGTFLGFDVSGRDDHDVLLFPLLWNDHVKRYLGEIRSGRQ